MANNANLPSRSMKIRTKIFMTTVFVGLFATVTGKFFQLAVLDSKQYQEMANDRHFGSIPISAHRGSIYDAKGTALARSATVYKVILDPKQFKEEMESLQKRIDRRTEDIKNGTYKPKVTTITNDDGTVTEQIIEDTLPASALAFREEAVKILSEKLGISAEKVTKAMDADNQYSILQEQVEKPLADDVLELFTQYDMISLFVEPDTKRYYPQNELASQVIGFTNSDGEGIYGIEAYYDDYLSGIDGKTVSAKDSHGNNLPYRYAKTFPAKDGNDIYLTIDQTIQHYLEKHLEEMVIEHQIKNRGCAILMNAKSGAIYGMATYPSFDLNDPFELVDPLDIAALAAIKNDDEEYTRKQGEFREKQWNNKCISELYEPGSVFKVNTSAAAIEENLVNVKTDSFICNGSVIMEGHPEPIRCHLKYGGHGVETFQQALTNSCNPAFMEIGRRLGIDKFLYYYEALGLRERTGIDLPAEAAGFQKYPDDMTHVDLAYSAFGQCETITPIEMITSYCAAINGGYLLKPYVVDKILDEDGNVVLKNERTVRRQVYSEETSAIMRDALYHVTIDNGAGNVTIKGYAIGGKSGTSERRSELKVTAPAGQQLGDQDIEYGASYCCFTPADDPEIILLVLGDMPYNGDERYYGSSVAVPAARDILTDVLPYLGISPQYTDEELEDLDVKIPLLDGTVDEAKETLDGLGINYVVIGKGSTVVSQSPQTGASVAKDGTVYLYTEVRHVVDYETVPDVKGCSPEYAKSSIYGSNMNFIARGASTKRDGVVVSSQTPAAGEKMPWGTPIIVEFMSYGDGD